MSDELIWVQHPDLPDGQWEQVRRSALRHLGRAGWVEVDADHVQARDDQAAAERLALRERMAGEPEPAPEPPPRRRSVKVQAAPAEATATVEAPGE